MATHDSLQRHRIDTPLGPMIALADETHLYLLKFEGQRGLEKRVGAAREGRPSPILSIESELQRYFEGKLQQFKTPLKLEGTPFQNRVWEELCQIPHGTTISYAELARRIGRPTAFRAVARANSTNPLTLIVPCHRVINKNGELGGYACGLERKLSLLQLEGQPNSE